MKYSALTSEAQKEVLGDKILQIERQHYTISLELKQLDSLPPSRDTDLRIIELHITLESLEKSLNSIHGK